MSSTMERRILCHGSSSGTIPTFHIQWMGAEDGKINKNDGNDDDVLFDHEQQSYEGNDDDVDSQEHFNEWWSDQKRKVCRGNAGESRGSRQDDKKRVRMEASEEQGEENQPNLFDLWIKMKKEKRQDPKLQQLADAFIQPEDIYQHFKEFIPQDNNVFMQRLQYERESAERALSNCVARSWLLRRSSLNRRRVALRLPQQLLMNDERQVFQPNDPQKPYFYAFSYSSASGQSTNHILIMKWKNLWARCNCQDGVEIVPTFYTHSFVTVLERLFESEDLQPDRIVHGYLSA